LSGGITRFEISTLEREAEHFVVVAAAPGIVDLKGQTIAMGQRL
jgi:hypothetical protein